MLWCPLYFLTPKAGEDRSSLERDKNMKRLGLRWNLRNPIKIPGIYTELMAKSLTENPEPWPFPKSLISAVWKPVFLRKNFLPKHRKSLRETSFFPQPVAWLTQLLPFPESQVFPLIWTSVALHPGLLHPQLVPVGKQWTAG